MLDSHGRQRVLSSIATEMIVTSVAELRQRNVHWNEDTLAHTYH